MFDFYLLYFIGFFFGEYYQTLKKRQTTDSWFKFGKLKDRTH